MTDDELRQTIQQAVHQAVRGVGKPWYARSPGKDVVAHLATLATAVGIGFVIHRWTGGAVVIEAKNVPVVEDALSRGVEAVPAASASAVAVSELPDASPAAAAVAAAPTAARRDRKPTLTVQGPELAAAPAAGAPAAPAPAAATSTPAPRAPGRMGF